MKDQRHKRRVLKARPDAQLVNRKTYFYILIPNFGDRGLYLGGGDTEAAAWRTASQNLIQFVGGPCAGKYQMRWPNSSWPPGLLGQGKIYRRNEKPDINNHGTYRYKDGKLVWKRWTVKQFKSYMKEIEEYDSRLHKRNVRTGRRRIPTAQLRQAAQG